jgi:hypothetical protein
MTGAQQIFSLAFLPKNPADTYHVEGFIRTKIIVATACKHVGMALEIMGDTT